MRNGRDAYNEILSDFDLAPVLQGPWAVVGQPTGQQGWKLHISSIPIEVELLLSSVVPYLKERQLSFKIAKERAVLEGLNSGALGNPRVGKFMTIYPAQESVRNVAEELAAITEGFHGPAIPTDLRIGSVLYARFGGFSPQLRRDRLGRFHLQIQTPEGLVADDEYRAGAAIASGSSHPFVGLERKPEAQSIQGAKNFGPGYMVLDVLSERAKGSVVLALCVKSQTQVAAKVLKQGRQFCMSDQHGRDARWILQRELQFHRHLEGISGIPRADEYFEVAGDGFLVVEYFNGQTIEAFVAAVLGRRQWATADRASRTRVLRVLVDFFGLVEALHARGFVHRDISNANVWVRKDETTALLDLEMGHMVGDETPPVGSGTPGFISPQQRDGAAPAPADDVFSASSVALLALTGIDPRRVLFAPPEIRERQLVELTGRSSEIAGLLKLVALGLNPNAEVRPSIRLFCEAAQRALDDLETTQSALIGTAALNQVTRLPDLESMIARGVKGLLNDVPVAASGVWLSIPLWAGEQGVSADELEPLRSMHTGVSGTVYLLSRLARFGLIDGDAVRRTKQAIDWVLERRFAADIDLPGLYFGEAGVALSIHEAAKAGLVDRPKDVLPAIRPLLEGPLDWPDLTHGAAGQGVAALMCDPPLATRCANFLIASQNPDGSWAVPAGFKDLSGKKFTGFAHGTAGIVYFLAEYAARSGSPDSARAWRSGINWLSAAAVRRDDGVIEWPYANDQTDRWKWWCHGSPGIALTYLRLFELTREPEFLATAVAGLQIHPPAVSYGNLSTCHGLSGLGEIYLEAFRVTQDQQWRDRATILANSIRTLGRASDTGGLVWLADDPVVPTADLGLGSSGIVHFLLRLFVGPTNLSFPLLFGSEIRSGRSVL